MTEQIEREVNLEGDEDVVSPKQAEELAEDLKETPESSPDVPEAEEAPVPTQPKPVEGETPREYALRKEVERLKKERRETEQGKIFNKVEKPIEDNSDIQELLDAGYSQEDIENSKKLIGILAPKLGLVNSKQTYQENANQTLSNFIEEHPEYSSTLDKDDIRWSRFNSIITSDYNLNGKTPARLKSIFERVDRDVILELGDAKIPSSDNKRSAQAQKISAVSHSAGTKPALVKASTKSSTIEAGGVKFVGFDDEDLV